MIEFFFLVAGAFYGFLFPGFAILKHLRIKAEGFLFLALAVLLSVLVSTHVVYLVSLVLGYSVLSILVAFALLSVLAYRLEWNLPEMELKPLAAGFGFFVLMLLLFATTLWVPSPQGVIVGGWNWSDLFAHLPIITSVNEGNFPPQTPFFAGEPLNYHWFVDFHTAFLGKLGFNPIDVIRFENSLYNALLLLVAFAFASRFLKSRAAWLAVVLFLFGGSFAYVNFFTDFAQNPTLDLIKENAYDNNWKEFQIPSLMGGYLVVQRAQMIGFPVLVAVLLLLWDGWRRKENLFLAGLMTSLLVPFQYFAFGATLGLAGLLFAYRTWEERKINFSFAYYVAPLVLAVPFILSALDIGQKAGLLQFTPGWLAPKEPLGFVFFYLANFGLVFIMALLAFKEKKILWTWMLALFMVPNLITLSGTQWDMTKFFAYMTLPASVLAAAWLSKQNNAIKTIGVSLSILTPLLFLAWMFQSTWIGLGAEELQAGEWIKNNTAQLSVFAAYPSYNSPIDSVGGRFRLTGYSSWMGNYGLNYQEREKALEKIYCGSAGESRTEIGRYNVSYVYSGENEKAKYPCAYPFEHMKKEYENGKVTIYGVKND